MACLVGKGRSDTSYGSWNQDSKHRQQAKLAGIFETIWPENGGPLPWRLTKVQVRELDARMKRCVWPHHMERLCYKGVWHRHHHVTVTTITDRHQYTYTRSISMDGGKSNVESPTQISVVEFYAVDTVKGHGPRGSSCAFAVHSHHHHVNFR